MLELLKSGLQSRDGFLEHFRPTELVLVRVFTISFPAIAHTLTTDGSGTVAFLEYVCSDSVAVSGRVINDQDSLVCAFDS